MCRPIRHTRARREASIAREREGRHIGPRGNRFYGKIIYEEPVVESIIMEAFTANKSRV